MMKSRPSKPTKAEILAAVGKTVPDLIAPGLKVLFCGINPSLYSSVVGHHFARPGNRFWPAIHAAGFTERLLSPFEEEEFLAHGYGITNLVERATAGANDLELAELLAGPQGLERKAHRYRPAFVAILGIETYRRAFGRRQATLGRQPEAIGHSTLWVLPNPSGLNAHYQLADLARLYGELRLATVESGGYNEIPHTESIER
jgi:double-stranded uracil-DNA glycosylase